MKIFSKYLAYYILGLVWLVPVLWMVSSTFKPLPEIISITPKWIPSKVTFDHIETILMEWPFLRWMLNSIIVSLGATLVALVTATPAAYSFARISWKGKNLIFVLFLSSMFIPWEINAIPLYFIARKLNLLNTYPGVFLPISAMPISVFLLRQFFISIPIELEDAARIDGCGYLKILWHVIIPISRPAFGALGIFIFIFTWNEFFWSLISLQQSKMLTLPIGLKTILGADDVAYGSLMACSFLASLPALIIFLLLRKQIISGISMSSVRK